MTSPAASLRRRPDCRHRRPSSRAPSLADAGSPVPGGVGAVGAASLVSTPSQPWSHRPRRDESGGSRRAPVRRGGRRPWSTLPFPLVISSIPDTWPLPSRSGQPRSSSESGAWTAVAENVGGDRHWRRGPGQLRPRCRHRPSRRRLASGLRRGLERGGHRHRVPPGDRRLSKSAAGRSSSILTTAEPGGRIDRPPRRRPPGCRPASMTVIDRAPTGAARGGHDDAARLGHQAGDDRGPVGSARS